MREQLLDRGIDEAQVGRVGSFHLGCSDGDEVRPGAADLGDVVGEAQATRGTGAEQQLGQPRFEERRLARASAPRV